MAAEKAPKAPPKSDKQRALEVFLASNHKKYGDEGARLSPKMSKTYDVVTTGSILLDDAIGIGGLPRGKVVELYGEEASGKTSLAYQIVGGCQKLWPTEYAAWVDLEHALNPDYAEQLGMQLDKMVISQPSSGEQALDEMIEMAASGAFSVIVLDSVGGLSTKAQLEKQVGEVTVGEVARLMSNNVKKITDAAARTNTLVIFINQLRTNIGSYGSPPTTMGGKALRFFASLRINIKRREAIVDAKTKEPIGQLQEYKIVKNRMGTPFKEVHTEFYFGTGFNPFKEVIDLAIGKDLIERAGAYYSLTKDLRFQGKQALIEFMSNNPKEFEKLRERLVDFMVNGVISEVEESPEELEKDDVTE